MPMTPEEAKSHYVNQAILKAGKSSVNALFEVAFDYETSGGNFTASFNGPTTAPIAFPPSALAFKTALELLLTIGAGGVNVIGPLGGPYFVEMVGGNAGQVVPPLLINGAALIPSQDVNVIEHQQGQTVSYEVEANAEWDSIESAINYVHRGLLVQLHLIDIRLNESSSNVDTIVGQNNLVNLKKSQEFTALETLRTRIEAEIQKIVGATGAQRRRTYGGVMTTKTPNGQPYGVLVPNPYTGRLE